MDKIVITGHKGFVGKNLFTQFTSVIGIDEKYDMKYINNFLDIHNPDVVFHIGACSDTLATDIGFVMERNYLSTKWITDWCITNNKKIIYASSAAVYGFDGKKPSNLYGWSKLMGEDYVVARGGIALRYFNVYGPGELVDSHMAAVIGKWRSQAEKNYPITIVGDGNQRRDFTHIDDIVDGLIKIAESDEKHEDAWELGTGNNYSLNEVYEMFKEKFNSVKVYMSEEKGNYRETIRINDDALNRLGWQPKDQLKEYINEIKLRNNGL